MRAPCAVLATIAALALAACGEPSASCTPQRMKIALDIGHDRTAPGAVSAFGVTEFSYNVALAQVVVAALTAGGFRGAFPIGESGDPLPLRDRAEIANDAKADLFLSLHHDSVQPRYLAEWSVNGKVEHYSDRFRGFSIFVSAKNARLKESETFAADLGEALLGEGLAPSLHHAEKIPGEGRDLLDARLGLYRDDNLGVLKAAAMPAVLLESGVIVNPAQERDIRSGAYHRRVAAAIVKAVARFCSARN